MILALTIAAAVWIAPAVVIGASAWWSNRGESCAPIPWPIALLYGLLWPMLAAWWVKDKLSGKRGAP